MQRKPLSFFFFFSFSFSLIASDKFDWENFYLFIGTLISSDLCAPFVRASRYYVADAAVSACYVEAILVC